MSSFVKSARRAWLRANLKRAKKSARNAGATEAQHAKAIADVKRFESSLARLAEGAPKGKKGRKKGKRKGRR